MSALNLRDERLLHRALDAAADELDLPVARRLAEADAARPPVAPPTFRGPT